MNGWDLKHSNKTWLLFISLYISFKFFKFIKCQNSNNVYSMNRSNYTINLYNWWVTEIMRKYFNNLNLKLNVKQLKSFIIISKNSSFLYLNLMTGLSINVIFKRQFADKYCVYAIQKVIFQNIFDILRLF